MSATRVRAFESSTDAEWAAATMARSEPWVTLGTGYERGLKLLGNDARERYLADVAGEHAGYVTGSTLSLNGGQYMAG